MGQRAFAGVGVTITVAGLIALMARSHWVTGATAVSTNGVPTTNGAGNVKELGTAVFTTYLFAFEATAALLVIAVVGAVLLARRERALGRGARVSVPAAWYLILAAILFGIGAFGLLDAPQRADHVHVH